MNYLKFTIGIFLVLAASRFIPHPPNFTSLIFSFVITDAIIGFHSVTIFTWGSVIIIGLLSKYFIKNIFSRISGALVGCCLFFLITNFGIWSLGTYGYTIEGFILCYTLAIPFFAHTIISTLLFSSIIEGLYMAYKKKLKIL